MATIVVTTSVAAKTAQTAEKPTVDTTTAPMMIVSTKSVGALGNIRAPFDYQLPSCLTQYAMYTDRHRTASRKNA